MLQSLLQKKHEYEQRLQTAASWFDMADILLELRDFRDELKKVHTEIDRMFNNRCRQIGDAIQQDMLESIQQGKEVLASHKARTCSYSHKEDISYKIADNDKFAACWGIHPSLISTRLFTPHYVNMVAALESTPALGSALQGTIDIERKNSITLRRNPAPKQEDHDDIPF